MSILAGLAAFVPFGGPTAQKLNEGGSTYHAGMAAFMMLADIQVAFMPAQFGGIQHIQELFSS